MGLVQPTTTGLLKTSVNSSDEFTILAFADIASRVSQQQKLHIDVLVTDDTKSNVNGNFGWVGMSINGGYME